MKPPAPDSSQTACPEVVLRRFRREESPGDFERALALRMAVFVQEQQVPEDEERDEYDEEAEHWLLLSAETGEALATGRMTTYQEACQMRPVAKVGRIAVAASMRGKGLGERLMRVIIGWAESQGFDQIILDAQTPVLGFYERLGFVAEGDEFMDAGIPHYRMRLVLA